MHTPEGQPGAGSDAGRDLLAACGGDRGCDVDHTEAESGVPPGSAGRCRLEDGGDLLRRSERRVRGPHERGGAGDLGRREGCAARPSVQARMGAGKPGARPPHARRPGRDRAEDVLAGCRERDVGARVREARAIAGHRAGGDREPDAALAVRARRLQRGGRILDRVPGRVLVSRSRDEQDVVLRRVLDCPLLELRGADAAEAEVDDLRAVVDRVDDRSRLVDVAEARPKLRRP